MSHSGRPSTDLHDVLQRIKGQDKKVPIMSDLREKGYSNDLADRYSQAGILYSSILLYRSMVKCRENLFGLGHGSTLRIRSILVDLLRWGGEFEDALVLALENYHHSGADQVPFVDHLASKTRLARTYCEIGQVDVAEQLQREVLAGYDDDSYKDHAFRLNSQVFLAEILESKGMFKEAADLSEDAEKRCSAALGDFHPVYTSAIRILAQACDGMGDLEKAISKGEHVELLSSRSLPKDHPVLIQDTATQGIRYYRNQNYNQAKEYYQKIQEAVERKPANATPAIRAATATALLLYQSGRADEAAKILEALISEAKKVLRLPDRHVASAIIALGKIYFDRGEYSKAEVIMCQALEADPPISEKLNRQALHAATTLAQCIAYQGRWIQSAQKDMETLLAVQKTPYLTESDEIGIITRAARSFIYARAWEEAIPLLEKEILWGKRQDEEKPIKYLCALTLLAICYLRLGQPSRMLELVREVLDCLQTPFEEDPDELISCLVSLGKRCMENLSFDAAGQLFGGSALLAAGLPDVSQYAKQMVNSATAEFLARGRLQEELEFNPSILDGEPL